MKKAKLIIFLIILLSAFTLLSSCGNGGKIDNRFVKLSVSNITFSKIDETVPISAEVMPFEPNANIEWSTSDPNVAVYEDGQIRSVGYGVCIIRATFGDITGTCAVSFPNPYSSIYIPQKLFTFDSLGAVAQISAFWGENNITNNIEWVSTNPDIAICNEKGVITSRNWGACLVMARSASQTTVVSVIVSDPAADRLTLSQNSVEMEIGETVTLTAEKTDALSTYTSWISSNPDIAECNNGIITANRNGTCTIIATADNGTSDTAVITVGTPEPAPIIPEDKLVFAMPNVPAVLHTTDPETGKIIASAMVTSHAVVPEFDENTGRLYLHITLNCVKIFDADGTGALNPVHIATTLYKENNEFCERRLYKNEAKRVGDEFIIECSLFSVQTSEGVIRDFTMTFDAICEK